MQKIFNDPKAGIRELVTRRVVAAAAFCLAGFFMGRIVVFAAINPAAVAYAVPFMGKGKRFYLMCVLISAGLITRFNLFFSVRYIMCFALLCGANFLFGQRLSEARITAKGAIGAACITVCGLIFTFVNGLGVYFALMAVLEGVLAFSLALVVKKGTDALSTGRGEMGGALSPEDTIAVMVLFGAVIAGASDIYIGWFSFMFFLCPLLVLVMAYGGGAAVGAAGGLLVGVLLTVAGMAGPEAAIIYGVSGLVCGAFKEMGKLPSATGLFAGAGLALYFIGPSFFTPEVALSVVLAVAAFRFIPNRFASNIYGVITPAYNNGEKYALSVKDAATRRLNAFAETLTGLSKGFGERSAKKEALTKKEANRLVDDIAALTCSDCPKAEMCWEESFYDTYKMVFGILHAYDTKESVEFSSIPEQFKNNCVRYKEFLTAADRYFEIYKMNLLWQNKMIESRAVVSEQLAGVADIINEISGELNEGVCFNPSLEAKIIEELAKRKIEPESVVAQKNADNRHTVYIVHGSELAPRTVTTRIIPAVSSVLVDMELPDDEFVVKRDDGRLKTYLTLTEKRRFGAASGVAVRAKTQSSESGDSYSVIKANESKCFVLSDGMGSGAVARRESARLIGMFEDYVSAGFSPANAIKIINSALLLQAGDESFATLDICTLNLYTGFCEFIKLGAAPSYIIQNGIVEPLRSRSLPAGAIAGAEPDFAKKRLSHGDIIVMATDGTTDSANDDWLSAALVKITKITQPGSPNAAPTTNPQEIAEHILALAEENYNGAVMDDMAVLVIRVWEKV